MPWDAKSFKGKHNHAASPAQAKKGAAQASAMVRSGVPDGIAIATANKTINRMRKRGSISERARGKMSSGLDRDPDLDAASR